MGNGKSRTSEQGETSGFCACQVIWYSCAFSEFVSVSDTEEGNYSIADPDGENFYCDDGECRFVANFGKEC